MSSPVSEIVKAMVGGAIQPIANIFVKKEERRQAKDAINGQVQLAKQQGQQEISIRASDWEIASKGQESGTWKDEYVTLSIFLPLNFIVFGSVMGAFGIESGTAAVKGSLEAIQTLTSMGIPMGPLMTLTAGAALSVKIVNGLR